MISSRKSNHSWERMLLIVAFALFVETVQTHADVGYAMRDDTRPFQNWDSAFNLSARDDSFDDGLALVLDKLTIRPTLGFTFGYSDNVYLRQSDEIDDTYYSVAPGVMLVYGSEEGQYLTLNYSYEMTKYFNEDLLDYNSHLFSGGLHLKPGKFQVHLQDQFSDSLEVDPETTRQTAKIQNTENFYANRYISRKTSFLLSQSYIINNYKDNHYLDYDELWVGGSLYHQTFPKIKTFGGVRYGIVDMSDANVIGDADYVTFDFGLQGRLTAKSTVHASVGIENREFKDKEKKSITDWVGLVGISSRYSSRTYWGIDVSRGLTPSSQRGGFTQLATTILPSWRHIFWRNRLSLSLSGSYELSHYYRPDGKEDRDDKYWYITSVLDWNVAKELTAGIGYTHTEQDSQIDEYDYVENRVFLRAMLNF